MHWDVMVRGWRDEVKGKFNELTKEKVIMDPYMGCDG